MQLLVERALLFLRSLVTNFSEGMASVLLWGSKSTNISCKELKKVKKLQTSSM